MIWVNGEIRSGDDPIIRAQDRGLLIGDGLFETVKVKAGKPVFLTEHLCRLAISARELALPIDRQEVREGVMALLRASPEVVGSVRITLTRGVGPRGLSPSRGQGQTPEIFITTAPESPYLEPKEEMGDRLLMAPHIRVSGAVTSRMKTLSYTDSLVVKGWAETKGAADAIFVNERDEVTCTTMANLFVQMEDHYLTPPLSAGVLPGIVRAQLLRWASRHGVDIRVRHIKISELWERPLFRANSLMGVRPGWLDYRASTPQTALAPRQELGRLYVLAEKDDIRV